MRHLPAAAAVRGAALGPCIRPRQQETKTVKRRTVLTAAGAAAAATVGAGVFAQQPILVKFSHVVTNDTPKGKGALRFQELAQKYTNGKVKVEVYPNSTLYKDKEELDALASGAVQMLAPSTAKFRPIGVPEFEAMDLPFIFNGEQGYYKTIDGPIGKSLLKMLEAKGITGLAYWDNGFHMVSANRPLLMPADFQGLKVRISGSKIADLYFRRLGALPQIMAFSEVYQALQTGVVDGCENTPSNYWTQKFYEVQKHITVSSHAHLQYALIANAKFWNGLPADVRGQLTKAMNEATEYTNSIAKQENVDALDKIKGTGKTELHYLTPQQRQAWIDAMRPVYKEAESRVGSKQIVDDLLKSAGIAA
jgi:C4-dicarboxylate-binding protein DctP